MDFERKARQTVARLARQAKESDMEMNTMQDQGFAMPTVEEPQHSQRTPLAEPQLGSYASSVCAWRLARAALSPSPSPHLS